MIIMNNPAKRSHIVYEITNLNMTWNIFIFIGMTFHYDRFYFINRRRESPIKYISIRQMCSKTGQKYSWDKKGGLTNQTMKESSEPDFYCK